MVTTQSVNERWWTHRSHESQALNSAFATKAEDEAKLLALQKIELERISNKQIRELLKTCPICKNPDMYRESNARICPHCGHTEVITK